MDPVVLGSLISGGSSLLGGLFGRKRDRGPSMEYQLQTQQNYQAQWLRDIRRIAKESGFNPLTILGSAPQPSASFSPQMPRMSSREVIGNAISDGLRAYRPTDPIETQTRELENELLQAQIDALRNETRESSLAFDRVPRVQSYPQPASNVANSSFPNIAKPVGSGTTFQFPNQRGDVMASQTVYSQTPDGQYEPLEFEGQLTGAWHRGDVVPYIVEGADRNFSRYLRAPVLAFDNAKRRIGRGLYENMIQAPRGSSSRRNSRGTPAWTIPPVTDYWRKGAN
jgi:hypothetical protein